MLLIVGISLCHIALTIPGEFGLEAARCRLAISRSSRLISPLTSNVLHAVMHVIPHSRIVNVSVDGECSKSENDKGVESTCVAGRILSPF